MKLTVRQVQLIWRGLNAIYSVNEILPGKFDYHMKRNIKILQPEIKALQDVDEEERESLADQEIEIPLSQIDPSILPDKMPQGALEAIQPILVDQHQPDHKSAIADLLKVRAKEEAA